MIAEAVARTQWEEGRRVGPDTPDEAPAGTSLRWRCRRRAPSMARPLGPWSCTPIGQEQRRHKRLEREGAGRPLPRWGTTVRAAAKQESCCRAEAEGPQPKQLRALQSAYHRVAVVSEERPQYGPGRPSQQQPRVVKALRYGLQVTLHERAEGRCPPAARGGLCCALDACAHGGGEGAEGGRGPAGL